MTEAELRDALARPVTLAERRETAARAEHGLAAAVLVPIVLTPTPRILLTRRADHLRHHGGQVSFPGGRIDPDDAGPEAAALREAWEEIALPPAAVEVIGRLSVLETGTGFLVTPIVGLVTPGVELRPAVDEVAELLTLPLGVLLDPAQPKHKRMKLKTGDWRDIWVWPHDEHYIWGATAAILLDLAQRLREAGP